ncbi:hypothetical protein Tco_0382225 [Tanacetum coccineum]
MGSGEGKLSVELRDESVSNSVLTKRRLGILLELIRQLAFYTRTTGYLQAPHIMQCRDIVLQKGVEHQSTQPFLCRQERNSERDSSETNIAEKLARISVNGGSSGSKKSPSQLTDEINN